MVAETAPLGEPDAAATADTAVAADEVLPLPHSRRTFDAGRRVAARPGLDGPWMGFAPRHQPAVAEGRRTGHGRRSPPYDRRAIRQRVTNGAPRTTSMERASHHELRMRGLTSVRRSRPAPSDRARGAAADARVCHRSTPRRMPHARRRLPRRRRTGARCWAMARGQPPAPRPTPVNASYNSN